MKKTLISLSLSLLLGVAPFAVTAAQSTLPSNVSVAPAIPTQTLQSLSWQPLVPPISQEVTLSASSQTLNLGDIEGAVAAFALPADRGSLEITLSSLAQGLSVYAPSVLILDEQMRPAAFYPSSYFPYEQPGVLSQDRLEGTMKLTPALGQKQIYMLVYTTRQDAAKTTTLMAPAKAYAAGVGNAIPDIPDPIARHATTGTLKVKVKAEQSTGNVMIGLIQSAPTAAPIVVGQAPAPMSATLVAESAPAKPSEPMLNDTESYFNNAIKQAVKEGDIDKALKLLDEAERLGSKTARKTFIGSVKGKG
jgi:maltose operon protein